MKPLVGDVVAMDSAEDIYRYALEQEEVDIEGVHPSAFRSRLKRKSAPIRRVSRVKRHWRWMARP